MRYRIVYKGHTWEVDEFTGANHGLTVAEVELKDAKEQVELPDWIDREVSGDPRYFNSNLVDQTIHDLEIIHRRMLL